MTTGERLRVVNDYGLVLDLDQGSRLITGFLGHYRSRVAANFIAKLGEAGYLCEVVDRDAQAIHGLSSWHFEVSSTESSTPVELGHAVLERVTEHYKLDA